MLDLVFDTETNDFPIFDAPHTDPRQAYMMQFGMVVLKDRYPIFETGFLITYSAIELPEVSPGAYNAHNITWQMCNEYGMPAEIASALIMKWMNKADRLFAHNARFDKKILRTFLHRMRAKSDPFAEKPLYCTMLSSVPHAKIPNARGSGYKWPKLIEAYKKLVDPNGFLDAHNASADTWACARILHALEDGNHNLTMVPFKESPQ